MEARIELATTLTYATRVNKILGEYSRNPEGWDEYREHLLLMEIVYLMELKRNPNTAPLIDADKPTMLNLHGKNALELLGVTSWQELVSLAQGTKRLTSLNRAKFVDRENPDHKHMKIFVEACLDFELSDIE